MNLPGLAVTGSTGALGRLVAADLAAAGLAQRLLVRDPARAPDLAGAVPVRSEYAATPAVVESLAGVETLLWVSGAEDAERLAQHRAMLDSIVEAGVRHVVYTSLFGAAPECTFLLGRDHWQTEQWVRESGVAFTFLRDNLYLEFVPMLAGEDGVIRGPAGTGRMAAVSRRDIAAVASTVLRDPAAHAGATYDLTGPDSFTLTEAAERLTKMLGRPHRFVDETRHEAYASRRRYDAPEWLVDAWVSTYTAVAAGELDGVTGDVERVTGTPPLSLEDVLARTIPPLP